MLIIENIKDYKFLFSVMRNSWKIYDGFIVCGLAVRHKTNPRIIENSWNGLEQQNIYINKHHHNTTTTMKQITPDHALQFKNR